MEVHLNFDYCEEDLKEFPLRELALFALAEEGLPQDSEVSITFVDNEAMAELNKDYRQKIGETDVLSFECDGVDGDWDKVSGIEGAMYEIGDVVIAPDVAKDQMVEYGVSFEQEISLLMVHGLLHLCGYDHVDDEDALHMEKREGEILESWANRR